jgi:Xaa-Pro dipeptidase
MAGGEVERPEGHAVFTRSEYAGRRQAVQALMWQRGVDVLLAVNPEDLYYLVGINHQGYFAFTMLVLPSRGSPLLISRDMDRAANTAQLVDCELTTFADGEDPAEVAARALAQVAASNVVIGVPRASMCLPPRIWERMRSGPYRWADGSGLIERVRAVKSAAEIAVVRRAAALSDQAMAAGIGAVEAGVNEVTVAAEVYQTMIRGGGEVPGFAPIVHSTDIFDQGHMGWRDHTLRPGEGLFMELSASVVRYHAPLTRIAQVGRATARTRAAAEIAVAGLEEIGRALVPGAAAAEVHAAWRRLVDEAGAQADFQRQHCGYLVGIGFPPSWVGGNGVQGLQAGSELTIRPGMVFHAFSWITGRPGDYAVSDTVLVTAGGAEFLTSTARMPSAL